MSKKLYGKDAGIDFTTSFKAKKRWIAEVETFRKEMEKSEGKYQVDTSQSEKGIIRVTVHDFTDGPLKTSLKGKKGTLVMNIEISQAYPMSPPFVWIESPTLTYSPKNLSFGIFNGVPCLKELNEAGWTPIFNLSSIFVFILNALAENTSVSQADGRVQRSQALSGSEQILRSHPDWK